MTARARTATVLSHQRPGQTADALRMLIEAAEREGVLLRFDGDETRKYGLKPREGLVLDAPLSDDVELCVVLGGDGTILTALRHATPLGVPVLGVNFGHVGFLADVDRAGLAAALDELADGRATVEERSAVTLNAPGISALAANDIALDRRPGEGPARVALTLAGVPLASLVGDGVLFASPGGSTAHNLNAGGPVLSPLIRALVLRTLNARAPMPGALVLHEDEPVTVKVADRGPALTVEVDGRLVGELPPGDEATVGVPATPARLLRTRPPQFFGELAERLGRL
jgi:NAD+ kinase